MEKTLSGKDEMLARIRGTLQPKATTPPPNPLAPFAYALAVATSQSKLADRFTTEVVRLGGRVIEIRSVAEVNVYLESLLPVGKRATVTLSDAVAASVPELRQVAYG
jgi:hypothetical protein